MLRRGLLGVRGVPTNLWQLRMYFMRSPPAQCSMTMYTKASSCTWSVMEMTLLCPATRFMRAASRLAASLSWARDVLSKPMPSPLRLAGLIFLTAYLTPSATLVATNTSPNDPLPSTVPTVYSRPKLDVVRRAGQSSRLRGSPSPDVEASGIHLPPPPLPLPPSPLPSSSCRAREPDPDMAMEAASDEPAAPPGGLVLVFSCDLSSVPSENVTRAPLWRLGLEEATVPLDVSALVDQA